MSIVHRGWKRSSVLSMSLLMSICRYSFPCHLRTREKIEASDLAYYFTNQTSEACSGGICLCRLLTIFDFLKLTTEARIVLTDSGCAQEETTILGIPCLSLRENTECPVPVAEGTNTIAGAERGNIVAKALTIFRQPRITISCPRTVV